MLARKKVYASAQTHTYLYANNASVYFALEYYAIVKATMLTVALVSWRNGGAKSSRVCVRVYACLNALLSARYLYENLADDVVNAKCTSTPINRLFTIGRANMCTGYTNYAPPPQRYAHLARDRRTAGGVFGAANNLSDNISV